MKAAQIKKELSALWSDQAGVTSIEYALLGALIALVIVGSVTLLGQSVLALYESVVAAFP